MVEKYMNEFLDTLGEKMSICVKNRDLDGVKAYTEILEKLTGTDNLEKQIGLAELPKSEPVIEIDLKKLQSSLIFDNEEEVPGQNYSSPEPKEHSLSKQVVWDFVIEHLINNKFECKATDLADAFENKYEYQFNSFDMKIRTSTDKRGNRERQIVTWKQRLWQVTSEMRRNHIIIGGKDNLYILAPKHRPE
jgi:hypothetical protein